MSTIKWSAYNAGETAIASSALNGLAAAAYVFGPEIDNSSGLFLLADLALDLSAAVSSTYPATLAVYVLPNLTGSYVASSGAPPASQLRGIFSGPGGSIQNMQVTGIVLPPSKFRLVLYNGLGAALPSGAGNTATLLRYAEQVA